MIQLLTELISKNNVYFATNVAVSQKPNVIKVNYKLGFYSQKSRLISEKKIVIQIKLRVWK